LITHTQRLEDDEIIERLYEDPGRTNERKYNISQRAYF
jgi:hypothetical protein